jgi:transcription termination factor Rho
MTSVLDRDELEQSPLADLHLLGNELGIDGFRRLRKADLVDAILARQSGEEPAASDDGDASDADGDDAPARPRRTRGGRGRGRARDADSDSDEDAESSTVAAEQAAATADDDDDDAAGRRNNRRGRRGRGRDEDDKPAEDKVAEGTVELMANGSGFIRVNHPETSDDDVYVSAAQVKRCELVSGDKVAGPLRAPRRSERFPSLIRVDTINGKPADEVAEGTKFEDLPATFATERFEFGSEDPTVTAIEWLAPFGKGSRVSVVGGSQSGKSEALRRIAGALAGREGLEVSVVLAGVRPEEIGDWAEGLAPAAAVSFAASAEAQAQAIESVVEQGRRVAARGGDAVVIVDSLEHVPAHAARRLVSAARNIADGGSLTIIAAATKPVGGETTVVALDNTLTRQRRFPALDLTTSGTMRAELLVGEQGAEEIARKRAEVEASR